MNSIKRHTVAALFACSISYIPAQDIRCELSLNSCIDYADTLPGSYDITVPENTTRIARAPLSLCLNELTEKKPVDVVFAVDQSGSMFGATNSDNCPGCPRDPDFNTPKAVQNAIQYLQAELGQDAANANVGFLGFANGICDGNPNTDCGQYGAGVLCTGAPVSTLVRPASLTLTAALINNKTSYTEANHFFNCGRRGAGTEYNDAFEIAGSWLQDSLSSANRQVIIFLTDGEPNAGNFQNANSAFVAARDSTNFPTVYVLFLNPVNGDGYDNLERLTEKTGGRIYDLNSADEVSGIMQQIIEENIAADPTGSAILNATNGRSGTALQHASTGTPGEYSIELDKVVALDEGVVNAIAFRTNARNTPPQTLHAGISVTGPAITSLNAQLPDVSPFRLECMPAAQIEFTDTGFTQAYAGEVNWEQSRVGIRLVTSASLDSGQTVSLSGGLSQNVTLNGRQEGLTQTAQLALGSTVTAEWVNPDDPRDRAAGSFIAVDNSQENVSITFRASVDGPPATSFPDSLSQFIVEVDYNKTYLNISSFEVTLTSLDGKDTLMVTVTRTAPGSRIYRGTVNFGFSETVNTSDNTIHGRLDSSGSADVIQARVTPTTVTYSETVEIASIPESVTLTFRENAGGPAVTSFSDSISQFIVEVDYSKTYLDIPSFEVTLTSRNGKDTLVVTVTRTAPGSRTYQGVVNFGFSGTISTSDNAIHGLLDPNSNGNADVIQARITPTTTTYLKTVSITSGYVPVSHAEIIDGDSDGRADTIRVYFIGDLSSLPDSITSIDWPAEGANNFTATRNEMSFGTRQDGTIDRSVVIIILEETESFTEDATGASPDSLPKLTVQGVPVEIRDKAKPVVVEVEKHPSNFNRYMVVDGGDSTILTQPDTLFIRLSEPIVFTSDSAWKNMFLVTADDSTIFILPVVGKPTLLDDGLTWIVLIDNTPGANTAMRDDNITLNPAADVSDLQNNTSAQRDVETNGSDGAKSGTANVFREQISGSPGSGPAVVLGQEQVPVFDGSGNALGTYSAEIILEDLWIPPVQMDNNGNINSSLACSDNESEMQFPTGCLASLAVRTEETDGPYTASVQIFDHLGNFIRSWKQRFGYCGEFQNSARRTQSGIPGVFISDLVWNQRDKEGQLVGSAVYFWKVEITFKSGEQRELLKRMGVVRNGEMKGDCAAH